MTFADDLNRMFAEAFVDMSRDLPPLEGASITMRRHTGWATASVEQFLDSGAITEEEARARGWTPPPPPTRRDRLRWRWQAWRERAGRKLGGWIAGVDLSERDEDW
jgi:hypothetical protein